MAAGFGDHHDLVGLGNNALKREEALAVGVSVEIPRFLDYQDVGYPFGIGGRFSLPWHVVQHPSPDTGPWNKGEIHPGGSPALHLHTDGFGPEKSIGRGDTAHIQETICFPAPPPGIDNGPSDR